MLDELSTEDNLRRAWRWLRTNPDASYKRYFRELYGIYAIADTRLLKRLQDLLKRGVYEPTKACKLFLPKPSGILRPYSLLTIEDQIVYQAAVNLVAERLFPKVKHRYNVEVFGHLYAGKTSTWFYRKWSDGYKAFNDAAREAFADGFRVTASFDLTACYDSLDHGVLEHMLQNVGCHLDFAKRLTEWLSVWTATDHGIYLNHGIPQGPLGSGLLSEVVLRHFDERRQSQGRVRYFRYVDDIRLFARSERDLRRMLVRLDLLSKDVGLFPQASKISIHRVKDIEDELKTVSQPSEAAIRRKTVDQARLRKRLVDLSPRFRVSNPTRFKYVLAHAQPDAKLTARLWRIFERHPELYGQLGRYLERYRKLPRKAADRLIREIEREELYPAVRDALLCAAAGRLDARADRRLTGLVKKEIWRPRYMPADLYASAGRRLIEAGRLTRAQMVYALRPDRPWWGRTQLVLSLSPANTAGALNEVLLNAGLRNGNADVALAAAFSIAMRSVTLRGPVRELHPAGAHVLRELGLINRTPPPPCGVDASFRRMLGSVPKINWKAVFGNKYRQVERHVVFTRALAETNATAWVNAMDVFDDWLLDALYAHDPTIGKYQLGKIGSVLNGGRLQAKYPAIYELADNVHSKRHQSALSHPKTKKSGRPTRQIRYTYLPFAKRLIRKALSELAAEW